MIFSTRKLLQVATGLALSSVGVGCMNNPPIVVKTPGSLAPQPMADEATEFRAARQSTAFYRSGATQGYPTRWYYAPDPDYSPAQSFLAESGMLVVQTLSLPVTLVIDPPFQKVIYTGDVLPPTYTAMPPLPPEIVNGPPTPAPDPISAQRAPLLPPLPPIPDEVPPMILPPAKKPVKVKPAATTEKSAAIKSPSTTLRFRGDPVTVKDSAKATTQPAR